MYRDAASDFERMVLSDGEITDQELNEMRARMEECLVGQGFSEVRFSREGGLSFDNPPGMSTARMQERAEECSRSSGEATIGALASWMRRNPDNLDENTIMAECLVRKGAVDPSYSARDYAADAPTNDFSFLGGSAGREHLAECGSDPLGVFER